ncbi:MAG: arylsulfatase [Puniceicoccaceae bacterium]|nr:MAG: arylsulfatase [Puniceicoccaceae bacterium]
MTDHPNVLLVCTDHWPGSLLGCAGHPAIRTPTLDQLARNGVYFPNAYSECPVCVPARRTLMTGLSPHSHGMVTNASRPMPEVPTLAQTFRDAGYQAVAVGKLHVQPQRQRLGFDEVILDEEGRGSEGCRADDYELFLGDHGYPGQRFAGGMCNNHYLWRPWHLEERFHVTNWAAAQMSRQIIRRDPLRPGFWYLSFSHPHPPLAPLQAYLELYRDLEVPDPYIGGWAAGEPDGLAVAIQREVQNLLNRGLDYTPVEIRAIRRAFYALCTHIDHQLRVVLGTLRQEGLLGNTILCFTADHGDMLGNHRLWAKHWMYEDSARVPMLLVGTDKQKYDGRVGHHRVDERLVGLRDVMPTLLDLAGVPDPGHCEGRSMVASGGHEHLFGAYGPLHASGKGNPTRMLRDARHKLIYYPAGNLVQVFDLQTDREERHDLGGDPDHAETVERLSRLLIKALPAEEREAWVTDGRLTGWPDASRAAPGPDFRFSGQRGLQWPSC